MILKNMEYVSHFQVSENIDFTILDKFFVPQIFF